MTATFPIIQFSFLSPIGALFCISAFFIIAIIGGLVFKKTEIRKSIALFITSTFFFLSSLHYITTYDDELSYKQLANLENLRKTLSTQHLKQFDNAIIKYKLSEYKITVGEYYQLREFAIAFGSATSPQTPTTARLFQ